VEARERSWRTTRKALLRPLVGGVAVSGEVSKRGNVYHPADSGMEVRRDSSLDSFSSIWDSVSRGENSSTKRSTTQVPSTWSSVSTRHPSPPYTLNLKQLEITSSSTAANTNPVLSGVSTFQRRKRRPCPFRHRARSRSARNDVADTVEAPKTRRWDEKGLKTKAKSAEFIPCFHLVILVV
jgi:hypothetical protein